MTLSPKQEVRSIKLLRLSGYGLLIFFALDVIQLMIPLRIMNAEWEFQFIGALVERAVLPFLGVILAFHGEPPAPGSLEGSVLKGISRLSLALAVLFLLLVPLEIVDTGRVRRTVDARLQEQAAQADQQRARVRDLRGKLTTAQGAADIAAALASQNIPTSALDFSDEEKLKTYLLAELGKTESNLTTQTEQALSDTLQMLYKNSIKWTLGALLASGLFVRVWQKTRTPAADAVAFVALLRLGGFGLLALVLLDFVHSLFPLHPRNPAWQLGLLTNSVDRLPMLWLGLALLFFGERSGRGPASMLMARGLSYLCMVLAGWYLLLIPVGVINAHILSRNIDAEAGRRLALMQESVTRQMDAGRIALSGGGQSPDAGATEAAAKAGGMIESQVQSFRSERRLFLYKSAAKGVLAALLAVVVFIQIWRLTRWVSRPEDQEW